MRNFLLSIVVLFSLNIAYANDYFYIDKCKNPELSCLNEIMKNTPYIVKIYNIICIPYYSSILAKKEPLFLKLVNAENTESNNIFDEYNYKTSEIELVKYI